MNLKNISSSPWKTSRPVTQFAGGSVDKLSSQIYFAWLATSYISLVSYRSLICVTFSNTFLDSAVSVERIFSAGRDTKSLRCASLHADTIHILMLIKKQLHLARAQDKATLHRWTSRPLFHLQIHPRPFIRRCSDNMHVLSYRITQFILTPWLSSSLIHYIYRFEL